jgi:spore coat protein A
MFSKSLVALAYALMPSLHASFPSHPFQPSNKDFTQYTDPLPIPAHISAHPRRSGAPAVITITESQFKTSLHRDLPEQMVWGYNGTSPGPVIDVEKGQKVIIHWKNKLPTTHLFKDPGLPLSIRLGLCLPNTPDVRTVTHVHGAEVTETNPTDHLHNNDGWPDSWVLPGQEQIAEYPNHQDARTMWYHDHAMGTTGRNVAAGLTGFYFIHDDYERSLGLPSGKYEIPLMLQAHSLDDSGLLQYANDVNLEMYGNSVSVNGKLWPTLAVEPRKYRFRMVNGSNARSYSMKIIDFNDQSDGPIIYQIGSDSGFLEKPVAFNDPSEVNAPRLLLAPGERGDLIVDFSQFAGKTLLLQNTSRDPGDGEIAMPGLMTFKVSSTVTTPDYSQMPTHFKRIVRMAPADATQVRRIVLAQSTTPTGDSMLTLNGKTWNEPVEENPKLGTTEVWELTNTLPDTHPFHLHLVQFQVLDRTPYDTTEFLAHGNVVLTGPAIPPDANEMGWKDTVRVTGSSITRIIIRFLPYPGFYVYHCHILEHEDMDMMRPFQIVP